MRASSKVLDSAAESLPAVKGYPIQRYHLIPGGAGKLICNSVGGDIVTGFLRLNGRENKRR